MEKKYDIKNFSLDDMKNLIKNGDDSHDNPIRVTKDGMIYLSQDVVAADNLENIIFRLETFDSGLDYVGKAASEDNNLIKKLYNVIMDNYKKGWPESFCDDWNI